MATCVGSTQGQKKTWNISTVKHVCELIWSALISWNSTGFTNNVNDGSVLLCDSGSACIAPSLCFHIRYLSYYTYSTWSAQEYTQWHSTWILSQIKQGLCAFTRNDDCTVWLWLSPAKISTCYLLPVVLCLCFHKLGNLLCPPPPVPLCSQDGDPWGWEKSIVPHSTFLTGLSAPSEYL